MITFNLTFKTSQDGFTPNAAQQTAMNLAASNWGKLFAHDATLNLVVESTNDPNSSTLMSAASNIPEFAPAAGFNTSEVVRQKVLTGNDLNGNEADGVIEVNWGIDWELDSNQTPDKSIDEFDFYSTFYHEINHALGFSSAINDDGTDAYGGGTVSSNEPGVWGYFDQFVSDSQGQRLINDQLLLNAQDYQALLTGGNSANDQGLFFAGPNALAANGGQPVGLYTPNQFSAGSSGSHLDDDNAALTNFLMLSATDAGPGARSLHPIEQAIFKDLGYSLVSNNNSRGINDFGQDGRSDLLWANRTTGALAYWSIQSISTDRNSKTSAFLNTESTAGWDVVGAIDFDADGDSDILMRHSDRDQNRVLIMNGVNQVSALDIGGNRPVANPNWRMKAAGNFDGDSAIEILWRNQATGGFAIWDMNGADATASFVDLTVLGLGVGGALSNLAWEIQATADFDGDGRDEILWRNTATGGNALWDLEGNVVQSSVFLPQLSALGWEMIDAADYDQDGQVDIAWRNAATGQNAVWQVEQQAGVYVKTDSSFIQSLAAPDWYAV